MKLSEAIRTIQPAIAQISVVAWNVDMVQGQPILSEFLHENIGTGFIVNEDGYVITARHVVEHGNSILNLIGPVKKTLVISLAVENLALIRGNFVDIMCDVVDEDVRNDICLLKPVRNPFDKRLGSGISHQGRPLLLLRGTVRLNPNRPNDGERIGVSGYPFKKTVLITNGGHVASSWEYNLDLLDDEEYTQPELIERYIGDVEVNPGNSGGPVFLVEDATIIGVCVSNEGSPIWTEAGKSAEILGKKLYYSSGLTEIIPSRYIIELLERNSISWTSGVLDKKSVE